MLKSEQIPSVSEYECAGHVRVCLCVSLTVMIQRGCSLYSTFIWLINENSLKPHYWSASSSPRSASASPLPHVCLHTSPFSAHILSVYLQLSFISYCKGQSNYTGMKTKPSEVPYHSWYDLRGWPSPLPLQIQMIKKKKTNAVDAKLNTHTIYFVLYSFCIKIF